MDFLKTDTIIFGSGISAYFVKKHNKKAIVITKNTFNTSLKSGGFFRTKGFNKKTIYDSILEKNHDLINKQNLLSFCEFIKNIKNFKEFQKSDKWEFGFRNKLCFLKKFQDTVFVGELIDLIIFKKKLLVVL
jgi:hypothetical protein